MFISSKFACFSLLAAVLYVIVCTSNAKTQISHNSPSSHAKSHQNLTSSKTQNSKKSRFSGRFFLPNPSSENPESSTSSDFLTSPGQAPPTRIQNPHIQSPRIYQWPQADIHCFIDDKLRKEVELFHVIGVRYQDSKMQISGPGDNFNFHFFDTTPPTVVRVPFPPIDKTTKPTSESESSTTTSEFSTTTTSPEVTSESTTSSESLTSSGSTSGSTSESTAQDTVTGNPQKSTVSRPKTTSKAPPPNFNTALNKVFTNGITVAWEEPLRRFHFLIPDKAYRHYQVDYQKYMDLTTHDDRSLGFQKFGAPYARSQNLTEPYTCHHNVKKNYSTCISIQDRLVTVGIYRKSQQVVENRFSLPNYLSFDKFFSYADGQGTDYILIHHRGQWIYRIDYQTYLKDQNMFFKVFQLQTPDGAYQFDDFEHADEYGLVTKYVHEWSGYKQYRYYYSLFSENSGLTTYCVHDKKIDGRLMILGREKIEQVKSPMEALRQMFPPASSEEFEFPTMLRVLFYCSLTYLSIFLLTQMIPNRRPLIFRDLRHTDREIQRLAPVIESIMSRVHTFLESTKNQKTANKKST